MELYEWMDFCYGYYGWGTWPRPEAWSRISKQDWLCLGTESRATPEFDIQVNGLERIGWWSDNGFHPATNVDDFLWSYCYIMCQPDGLSDPSSTYNWGSMINTTSLVPGADSITQN